MPAFSLSCPECRTTLKSAKPIAPGTVVTCPKCDVMFAAPAAAKPKMAKAKTADFEVVEDDDVVEAVEVVHDEPKKPAAAKKPAAKSKSEGSSKPRREMKAKPRKTSNQLLIALGAIAGIFLMLGGLGLLMWKLIGSFGDDAVAFLPEDSSMIMGARVGELARNVPALGAALDKAPPLPMFGGMSAREALHEVHIGVVGQFGLGQQPSGAGVLVTEKPFKKEDVTKGLGAAQSEGGQNVYPQPGGAGVVFVPTDKIIAFAMMPDRTRGDYISRAGRGRIDAELAAWKYKTADDHFYMLGKIDGAMRQQMTTADPNFPGVNDARGYTFRGKASSGTVELRIGLVCKDDASAKTVAPDLQKYYEKELSSPRLMLPLFAFPGIKSVVNEMKTSLKHEANGDFAEVVGTVSVAALEAAFSESAGLMQMLMRMQGGGGPGQMPRGGRS